MFLVAIFACSEFMVFANEDSVDWVISGDSGDCNEDGIFCYDFRRLDNRRQSKDQEFSSMSCSRMQVC